MTVAGDDATQTNHLFLVDVSDVPPTTGPGPDLLSPGVAHDLPELPYSIKSAGL